jgi:hypothetical protein
LSSRPPRRGARQKFKEITRLKKEILYKLDGPGHVLS